MAFDFIKKVFSFGRKDEKPAETPPAAAQEPVAAPDAEIMPPLREPSPAIADPVAADIAPEPSPVPEPPSPPEQPESPQPELAPEPLPVPPPAPQPAIPPEEPQPQEVPAPAPQELPAPFPQEVPVQPPVQVPAAPVEIPQPAPPEPPASPAPIPPTPRADAPSGELPAQAPGEVPQAESPQAVDAVPAEILPPIREPAPVPTDRLREEIAPEPDAIPVRPAQAPEAPKPDTPSEPPHPAVSQPVSPPERENTGPRVTVSKSVERKAEAAPTAPAPAPRTSWFQRLRDGLSRSSRELSSNIAGVFTKRKLDEDTLQDLEDVLLRADLGMETAIRITDALASGRYGREVSDAEVRTVMAAEVEKVLAPVALPLELDLNHKPHVILVVGVNGTGKTTTIGKLAAKLTQGGLKVMLAAGDTFRAAAIEQLGIWGERTGSPVVASKLGADAAGLAWDAYEKAKEAGSDVLIIDTAGRLQNKAELMAELEKIVRVLGKHDADAPHTVLQTVDATTGQNALNQVEIFRNVAGVNGLVMTKLDGTARGGILVAIAARHKLPVYFIGVGEQVDDLEPFSASEFAKAIAGVA